MQLRNDYGYYSVAFYPLNPPYISVRRVRRAQRLEQDLGVNVAGAALALELLEE